MVYAKCNLDPDKFGGESKEQNPKSIRGIPWNAVVTAADQSIRHSQLVSPINSCLSAVYSTSAPLPTHRDERVSLTTS